MAELRASCEKGFTLPEDRAVVHDWVIKGLVMSTRVYASECIKDPVLLIEKRRASRPVVGFSPRTFHSSSNPDHWAE